MNRTDGSFSRSAYPVSYGSITGPIDSRQASRMSGRGQRRSYWSSSMYHVSDDFRTDRLYHPFFCNHCRNICCGSDIKRRVVSRTSVRSRLSAKSVSDFRGCPLFNRDPGAAFDRQIKGAEIALTTAGAMTCGSAMILRN